MIEWRSMDDNLADILEMLNFIKDHMVMREEAVTRDAMPEILRPIVREEIVDALKPTEDRLMAVESKISGVNRRLDDEAMLRGDLSLPKRVADLEEATFGSSRHPRHVPLV